MIRSKYVAGFALAATIAAFAAQPGAAQSWPTRAVTMVVPFAPGSASDTVGRIVSIRMSELLGQQVVIENVGGAGGMTGAARVAKAPPDGYQFVLGGLDTFAQGPTLYKKPLYNPVADFVPVALVADQPLVLLIRKDIPANNLREFIAYAKENQSKMQYGSAGVGAGSHLACAQLNAAMGVDTIHVPYRGSGPAMQDLIAGRIDYFCALGAAATPQLASNTMKVAGDPDARALAAAARPADRARAGPHRFRFVFLGRDLRPQGHAGRRREAPERGRDRDARYAGDPGTAQDRGHDRGAGGQALAAVPEDVPGRGNRQVGGDHQGERRQLGLRTRLSIAAQPFGPSPGMVPGGRP